MQNRVERNKTITCWGTPFPVSEANEVGQEESEGRGRPLTHPINYRVRSSTFALFFGNSIAPLPVYAVSKIL